MTLFFRSLMIILIILQTGFARAQDSPTESTELEDIAWSSDGTRIAGLYADSRIEIWEVEDLSHPILTFQPDLADTIAWTPDSQYLIVQGTQTEEDGLLRKLVTKWDATTGTLAETLMSFQLDSGFEFNPYGYYIFPTLALDSTATKAAFSFRNGTVYLSDGIQVLHLEFDAATNNVYRMEWSPDGQHIAIVYGTSDTYNIQLFNIESGKLLRIILQDLQYFVTDLAWDASGKHLATSSMRYTCCEGWSNVGIYDIENDEPIDVEADRWWREIERYGAPIVWHPTKLILAIAGKDTIEFYDPSEETPLFTIAVAEAKDIEWAPDGTKIASVSSAGIMEIWDVSF